MTAHLAVALLALASSAGADRLRTVEALGRAPIAADALAAGQRAKEDALRGCVRQVVSELATAATDPDQARLLPAFVGARAVEFVRRLQVLEERREPGAWVTRVACAISEASLEEELLRVGVAHRRPGMPRLLVLIAEQPLDAAQPRGWWQRGAGGPGSRVAQDAFEARIERCGFPGAAPAPGAALEALGAWPEVAAAREAGRAAGAEVVVVGSAVARAIGERRLEGGATFHSAAARIAARAVRTDTGEVVTAIEHDTAPFPLAVDPGHGFDRAEAGRGALVEAGRALARELFPRLAALGAPGAAGVRRIALSVVGVRDYAALAELKLALLEEAPGVKAVEERSLEGGRAELVVALAGTSKGLATHLATRRLGGVAVKVTRVTEGAVEVELR